MNNKGKGSNGYKNTYLLLNFCFVGVSEKREFKLRNIPALSFWKEVIILSKSRMTIATCRVRQKRSFTYLHSFVSVYWALLQSITDCWLVKRRNLFLTVWKLGTPRSKHQQIPCLARSCFLVHRRHMLVVTACGRKDKGVLSDLL